MPQLIDFIPLWSESVETIRGRMDADVNAGLVPTDPEWLDLTPGGIYYDLREAISLEVERVWDGMSAEYVAVHFPTHAWGIYLDYHATSAGLERKDPVPASGMVRFTGDDGVLIATGTQVAAPSADPFAEPFLYATSEDGQILDPPGYIDVTAQAVTPGSASNVPVGAITILRSPVGGVTAVVSTTAMLGGADRENDEDLRSRLLLSYRGIHGGGTVADYETWALAFPGVGNVSVVPVAFGAGTVSVVITDANNRPVSAAIVNGLQQLLDPYNSQGRGLAPIGAAVTVSTPTMTTVDTAAEIVFEAGFGLDNTSGNLDLTPDIEASMRGYIDGLLPGEDVVRTAMLAAIIAVEGVYDVTSLTLNGGTVNVVIAIDEVAVSGAVTLTVAP